MPTILVTGAAGFIDFHTANRLLDRGCGFTFVQGDLLDRECLEQVFARHRFDGVINLAAQAGVRYSLVNPHAYVNSNVLGFLNVLEGCRHNQVGHLVFASSSSVYGANTKQPFSTHDHATTLCCYTRPRRNRTS